MMEGPRKRGTRGGTGLSRTKSRPLAPRRSVFFLRHISHEARLENDFRFAFFFQPPPSHSLSLGERVKGGEDRDREWWSGFDRSWDWFEFKKRERKKGKEGRTIEKGEFNTGKMVGLFMKMAFFVEVRWVSTPLLLALERARWTLAISN